EAVPHDLWPAGDWPPMSVVERLTLLAAQFDLSFRVEGAGQRVRLVKLTPDDVKIERTHTVPNGAAKIAEAWRAACPDAEIRLAGNKITVRGRLEDHEWLTSPGKNKVSTTSTGTTTVGTVAKGKTVYTLTIKNQKVRDVIRSLAERLNLTLEMDETAIRAAGINLEQRI